MSNYLGVAAVTACLKEYIAGAAITAVPGAKITSVRPNGTADASSARVNIYLYQTSPNPAFRNEELPHRNGNGSATAPPTAALDLKYLISFYGDENTQEPERLLGKVVTALHAQPFLTRETIRRIIQRIVESDGDHYIAGSDLAAQAETIRLTPATLDLEEMSKLWSVFFQTAYALSVAYTCSVVFLEADIPYSAPLPLRDRRLFIAPSRQPVVSGVVAQSDPNDPVLHDTPLHILGRALRGEVVSVRIGGRETVPDSVGEESIALTPPGDLRSGLHSVQVLHKRAQGTDLRPAGESNAVPLILRPSIIDLRTASVRRGPGDLREGLVIARVKPVPDLTQNTMLQLNAKTGNASRSFAVESVAGEEVRFQVRDIPPGEYMARVRVDGFESMLERNLNQSDADYGKFIGPAVVFPLNIPVPLIVSAINPRVRGNRIIADVRVHDDQGAGVAGATVNVAWTPPDGVVVNRTADTRANGLARLVLNDRAPGVFSIRVLGITLAGDFAFDPDSSILTAEIERT